MKMYTYEQIAQSFLLWTYFAIQKVEITLTEKEFQEHSIGYKIRILLDAFGEI